MDRVVVAACVVVLTACGAGSLGGPPSAQSVAQNDSDFPGMHRCQQSGSYDAYLKAEQKQNPSQYQSEKKMWDEIKAAGANDSYLAIYAQNSADCSQLPSLGNLSGKAAYVFAIRYKDTASAAGSFKTELAPFHLSASDVAQIASSGGTARQGSATGLGDNSVVVTFNGAGLSLYIALWQSKEFLVFVLADSVAPTTESAATNNINGRIH